MDESTGIIEEWKKAVLAKDSDAIAELYEDDAIFVYASMNIVARGKEEIRQAWKSMEALGDAVSVEILERAETIAGDYAFAHQSGNIRMRFAGSDDEGDLPFRTTEVIHRGEDGRWRYVIDHA